jgi:hypothetical protein
MASEKQRADDRIRKGVQTQAQSRNTREEQSETPRVAAGKEDGVRASQQGQAQGDANGEKTGVSSQQKAEIARTGNGDLVAKTQQRISDMMSEAESSTTPLLKKQLCDLLGLTAENLIKLSVVVHVLEKRGEDLSQIKMGLLPILRNIASGSLLPEVVVMYGCQPGTMKLIAALPVDEQREVVEKRRPAPTSRPRVTYSDPAGRKPMAPGGAIVEGDRPIDQAIHELRLILERYAYLPQLKPVKAALASVQS